jgi:membrane-bound metal-dependent hydrolase YbcI (DUF457 family)
LSHPEAIIVRGFTHAVLGAAIVVPVALNQDPPLAVGCLVAGVIGGGAPDWLDFRSGLRAPFRLRHRGASHGLPMLVLLAAALAVATKVTSAAEFAVGDYVFHISDATIASLVLAFALGCLSHLLSDACTISGIQPLLPFAKWRIWLLPRMLRSRTDGYLDKVARLGGFTVLGFALVLYVMNLTASW